MKKKKQKSAENELCPCGGYQGHSLFKDCCGPYLSGADVTANAECLMRSRYSAYVYQDEHYLLKTWHPQTRPESLDLSDSRTQWIGLTVHEFHEVDETHQEVSFTAKYKDNGRAFKMREHSRFIKEGGRWFYLDGDDLDDQK